MIAWINGIKVEGTPKEIEEFRVITAKKESSVDGFFKQTKSDIPEHVKKYGSCSATYTKKDDSEIRVWI